MDNNLNYKMIIIVIIIIVLSASNALAYLDPGSGSMLIQAVLAGIAAASVSIGIFWNRIKAFFNRDKNEKSNTDAD